MADGDIRRHAPHAGRPRDPRGTESARILLHPATLRGARRFPVGALDRMDLIIW